MAESLREQAIKAMSRERHRQVAEWAGDVTVGPRPNEMGAALDGLLDWMRSQDSGPHRHIHCCEFGYALQVLRP